MPNNRIISSFIILSMFVFIGCNNSNTDKENWPQPTDIIIKKNPKEGGGNALKRAEWLDRMHMTAPGQNWRLIEYQNRKDRAKQDLKYLAKDGIVSFADSLYSGKWEERGPTNQAGNISATNYLKETDEIYCISGGGTLWKGPRAGNQWEVVNQSYKFNSGNLEFLKKEDGTTRMIATIEAVPHYSDDMGVSWIESDGIISGGNFWNYTNKFETVRIDSNTTRIYCLNKINYWSDIDLFYSDDLGETYERILELEANRERKVDLCKINGTEEIFIATAGPQGKLNIDRINHETIEVEPYLLTDQDISESERLILEGSFTETDSILYTISDDSNLVKSSDGGFSWEVITIIPDRPWNVGMFIPPSDDTQLFYGEVEAFKLGTQGFEKIDEWWDYYNSVEWAIHADIMSLEEYETSDSISFMLIGNHGGLSISYDYMFTNQNLSLDQHNVAQFYDVKTDPFDPNFVYAGSQDQGFQRTGLMGEDGPVAFDQVISGDYGHITFSGMGSGMWMVYPGGDFSFYPNPQSGGPQNYYSIDSPDESNWLTPMTSIPGIFQNKVLVAGGSIDGAPGSYVIELTRGVFGIDAVQYPFNFKSNSNDGTITAIEVSPVNIDIIYVTVSDGSVFVSKDGGATFNSEFNMISNGHYLYGTSIHASTINENELWIAGSGYDVDGVMYSNDYGETFTNFSNGLPSTMIFEITANADETQFFAATEIGPYVYFEETGLWEDMSQGNAPVNTFWSVEYLEEQRIARFGSYGRGIWDFTFDEQINASNDNLVEHDLVEVYPNPVDDILFIKESDIEDLHNATVEVYSMEGKRIAQLPFTNEIDVQGLISGTYTLRIIDRDRIEVIQFVKI